MLAVKKETNPHFTQRFAVQEFRSEMYAFIITHQDYTTHFEHRSQATNTRLATDIVALYLTPGAPSELNVDTIVRESVQQQFAEAEAKVILFDGAVRAVLHLLEAESFPRFKKNQHFASMVDLMESRLQAGEHFHALGLL